MTAIPWSIVFLNVPQGQGKLDDLALLSISSARFARLSLDGLVDYGFQEIAELNSMANFLVKKTFLPEYSDPLTKELSMNCSSFSHRLTMLASHCRRPFP